MRIQHTKMVGIIGRVGSGSSLGLIVFSIAVVISRFVLTFFTKVKDFSNIRQVIVIRIEIELAESRECSEKKENREQANAGRY